MSVLSLSPDYISIFSITNEVTVYNTVNATIYGEKYINVNARKRLVKEYKQTINGVEKTFPSFYRFYIEGNYEIDVNDVILFYDLNQFYAIRAINKCYGHHFQVDCNLESVLYVKHSWIHENGNYCIFEDGTKALFEK